MAEDNIPAPPESLTESIEIAVTVKNRLPLVWEAWTDPDHIRNWNFASPKWYCPCACIDLRPGGAFTYRMEARDGSVGFDFSGTYTQVEEGKLIAFELTDHRRVQVSFTPQAEGVLVLQRFDPDKENPRDLQREGWQAIMDNFRYYAGSLTP